MRDGVLLVLPSVVHRDRYPQLLSFCLVWGCCSIFIDKVVDVGDAVALWRLVKEFHTFSTCSRCLLGIRTLFPRAPCSGSHLPLCVATVHGSFWTNFVHFLREKCRAVLTLGNLELFLRAVSGIHRVRQSTFLFLEEFYICSSVLVVPASLRSSHLKIWTLFLLAVTWRWDGVFGGSDAFSRSSGLSRS